MFFVYIVLSWVHIKKLKLFNSKNYFFCEKNKKRYPKKIELENINISKNCGWAPEYVNLIFKLMQQKVFDDYVIGIGRKTSIKYILQKIFSKFNLILKRYLVINKKYFRQKDIKIGYADISKIKKN